jgi:uncharacterized membrane protein YhaH (DUF805 family)
MQGVIGYIESVGPIHSAFTCVTTTGGQAVCTEPSAGLFASFGILAIIEIAVAVLGIVAAVKVVSKAGYSGWWVLIALVPIVGSVFILVFAFSTWPVTLEVQGLRAQLAARNYGVPGGQGFEPSFRESVPATAHGSVMTSAQPDHENVAMPSFGQFLRSEKEGDVVPPDAPPAATQNPPAGWFPSPGGPPGQQRYWDGSRWTDHFA